MVMIISLTLNDIRKQTLEISEVTLGEVNKIGITTGGTNYKVDDKVFLITQELVV